MTGSVPAEADAAKDNAVHKLELSDPAKDTGDLKQEEAAPRFSLWRFAQFFGTGLLAAVAYLDPGNLEADIQLAVASGMSLIWWTAVCCLIFGFTYQCMSARLGLVTGQDLAVHLGARYPKSGRYLLWFLIELAIISADIQETVGCAIAVSILTSGKVPLWGGCLIVSAAAYLLLLLDRLGFRQLEAVFGTLIAIEAVAMGTNFIQAGIPSAEVAKGTFVPTLSASTVSVAVGALGAIVMPYNIFFQSAVVNGRPRDANTDDKKSVLLKYARLENFIVLLLAFVINLFVIGIFAHAFEGTNPDSAGLESAGDMLASEYGNVYRILWAVGLLASGQVATIGLTYAGQLIMMGLLNVKVQAVPRMMATRTVALIPTVTLAVLFEATNTFDTVAQTLNIVQSLLLPFALVPVVHVCADKKLLGRFVSHPALTAFAAFVAAIVAGVNGYLLVQLLVDALEDPAQLAGVSTAVLLVYYAILGYFAIGPDHLPGLYERGREVFNKASAWLRGRIRRADFESMLEVHI